MSCTMQLVGKSVFALCLTKGNRRVLKAASEKLEANQEERETNKRMDAVWLAVKAVRIRRLFRDEYV
jgi:hypothetical protein